MSNRQQERVKIECLKVLADTNKAVLAVFDIEADGIGVEVWIPLSQVHEVVRAGPEGAFIVMTPWIAKEKGLEDLVVHHG